MTSWYIRDEPSDFGELLKEGLIVSVGVEKGTLACAECFIYLFRSIVSCLGRRED